MQAPKMHADELEVSADLIAMLIKPRFPPRLSGDWRHMLGIERRADAVSRVTAVGEGGVGSARRARWQERGGFGERRSRLALVIIGGILAGVVAICAYQLGHGVYLGRGWVIAALAGMLTAAVLGAVVLIRQRRHVGRMGRFEIGWGVLWPLGVSGFRFPFPPVHYGSVQAFFNVVHAALLGYEAITSALFVALLAVLLFHPRGLGGWAVLRRVARARTTAGASRSH